MTREELDGGDIFVLRGFLSEAECAALSARAESMHYEVGTVGDVVFTDVRNNDRALFDDAALAAALFERARPQLPAVRDGMVLVGFNERWRFYRYGPGQTFKPHRDGAYHRLERFEESQLTFMIYLNDGMAGGETRFFLGLEDAFAGRPYLSVRPAAGTALVFAHRIFHEGAVVRHGQKLVLRTDVMYGIASLGGSAGSDPLQ
jgi:prolyl 4-hydroxylase